MNAFARKVAPHKARNVAEGLGPEPLPRYPLFAMQAALGLRRLLLELADLMVPAPVALVETALGVGRTMALAEAARLRVADILRDKKLSAEELARETGTNADALHRILRALATTGIFRLHADGRFSNNRLSRALLSEHPMRVRAFAEYIGSCANMEAWVDLPRTVSTGKSAFSRLHGTSVWQWFESHPEDRATFAEAMGGLTFVDAPLVASRYPFGEIHTICDVGGGRGMLLSELLLRHPHLSGTLCDAAGVLDEAEELLFARGVRDRVKLVPGSFFEAVPTGSDAYLLKNILHDWDDATCTNILKNVRRAMPPGGRVLVVETLTPRNVARGYGPLSDLQMMVVCDDGRERGVPEIRALFESCGLSLGRVFASPTAGIVEGRAA